MKNIISKLSYTVITASALLFSSCNKFEEMNTDRSAADGSQVQVEYFINGSMIGAQMDPHIAERIFILYWQTAGRQGQGGGISSGGYNDGWSSDYYGGGYMSGWLNSINAAIQVAEEQIAAGKAKTYTNNLLQVARVWRVYLMSELADTFGPIALNGYKGQTPIFSSLQDVYYFFLAELKDAAAKIDVAVTNPGDAVTKLDPAYNYNYTKWQKYANSMRMRLAMRLSEVDGTKAKAEFEDAAIDISKLITTADERFQVQEKPGWDALTGVMTREWNACFITATVNNLYVNLGGVTSESQLPAAYHASVKPQNYIGLKLDDHFTSKTNDPAAGYWFDGLPATIDPRAYKTYIIPGGFDNPNFNYYPSWATDASVTKRNLLDGAGAVVKEVDAKYTWNASSNGDWGTKGSKNQLRGFPGTYPRMSNKWRTSSDKRVFFGEWETYFLLAEAEVRGWNTPTTAQAAYESGIGASFAYFGVSDKLPSYLTSTDYNRVGTSVSFTHTTEPGASHNMDYINGYTNAAGTSSILYPVNSLYQNGTVRNDALTKIITQKFIAQTPWLPLETWSDQRRLGLPFFENPAIENSLVNMPDLNSGNFMTSNVKFFPQRVKYPTSIVAANAVGYDQAVGHLGGPDATLTPLWWAKH